MSPVRADDGHRGTHRGRGWAALVSDLERRAGKICPRYVGSKPIYEHSELKRWLEALPSEPPTRL